MRGYRGIRASEARDWIASKHTSKRCKRARPRERSRIDTERGSEAIYKRDKSLHQADSAEAGRNAQGGRSQASEQGNGPAGSQIR